MQNPIMPYPWGSTTAIGQLQGRSVPTEGPEAELWMGAHPKAPSRIQVDDRWAPMDHAIAADPVRYLGPAVTEKFDGQLPFLMKVLAAKAPLSIQAHPDMAMAKEGFARESRSGIRLDDPRRNFKDPFHKPELIVALTPFWALCGFREPAAVLDEVVRYCPETSHILLDILDDDSGGASLKIFMAHWFKLADELRQQVLHEAVDQAHRFADDPIADWVIRLSEHYPGDPGVIMPLVLNLVNLSPGQALALPPRTLHAYLDGVGIEVMANSDNVIRGGLTSKHIDIDELMGLVLFDPMAIPLVEQVDVSSTEIRFRTEADEFCLSRIRVSPAAPPHLSSHGSPMVLLCTKGQVRVTTSGSQRVDLKSGGSLFVTSNHGGVTITGEGVLFQASVPYPAEHSE